MCSQMVHEETESSPLDSLMCTLVAVNFACAFKSPEESRRDRPIGQPCTDTSCCQFRMCLHIQYLRNYGDLPIGQPCTDASPCQLYMCLHVPSQISRASRTLRVVSLGSMLSRIYTISRAPYKMEKHTKANKLCSATISA